MIQNFKWPYPLKWDKQRNIRTDVLILGGGIAGCWAAIAAARKGVKVALVEKGATIRSGAGGSGCDHWESAATNPCSKIAPEELTRAMIDDHGGYNNGISHYIECREGYDRLLDLEKMGAKIRDTEDDFKGAEFRDEKTKWRFQGQVLKALEQYFQDAANAKLNEQEQPKNTGGVFGDMPEITPEDDDIPY